MKRKILIFSLILVVIDQLIKKIIGLNLDYDVLKVIIPNFFYITNVKNTGGAFSILSNNINLLLLISLICTIGCCYYIYIKDNISKLGCIYFSLLMGGIVGNLIDRIFYHGVVDYLGFIFGCYYFPIFNFADICIVCGIGLLLIEEWVGDKNGIRSNKR